MNTTHTGLARHLRALVSRQTDHVLPDQQLLESFLCQRSEASFATLVRRHGPMVLGVCRRVLRHMQDAEDAFQATFLVLARKAATIRKHESLASWLHGVAHHTAQRLKAKIARRISHERRLIGRAAGDSLDDLSWRELRSVLDEELQRLPEKYRHPLILCYLHGQTQDEAARQLGWSKGAFRHRIDKARDLLGRRLTRRGLTLSAPLLIECTSGVAVPDLLAESTVHHGLAWAAGGDAMGVPARLAALAEQSAPATLSAPLKWGTVVLLAATLAVGGMLTRSALDAQSAETPLLPPVTQPHLPAVAPSKDRTIAVKGQVHDPDGKPLAGAEVFLVTKAARKRADLTVRATTDKNGHFRLKAPQGDVVTQTKVLARARGYGSDWVELGDKREVKLRLVKDDLPLSGRVLDLEGQPVAGATVRVFRVGKMPGGADLGPWLDKNARMRRAGTYLNEQGLAVISVDLLGVPATATTGADGRFRLIGYGRDRVVRLNIEGPNIVWRKAWAVTRPGPPRGFIPGRDAWDVFAAHLEYIAGPCKPIIGTVREKGTGKPLAGILVGSAMHGDIETTTDKDGRYRIVGAAKKPRYCVVAEGERYFNCTKHDIADTPGLEPITVNFELERGILMRGRVTNKVTGEPVRGLVFYCALADNPHLKDFKEIGSTGRVHLGNPLDTAIDGSFTALGIPGPGLLCVRADNGAFVEAKPVDAKGARFQTVPNIVLTGHHALVPVNISEKDPKTHVYDIALDPGRSVQGTVIGPDGKPLTGTHIQGLTSTQAVSEGPERKDAAFTVRGLEPSRERTLIFYHEEKKLGKVLRMRGDEKGPLTVQLEPLGIVAGRMIDAAGRPLAGLTVRVRQSYPAFDCKTTTDRDGKFRVEGILPQVKCMLAIAYGDPWERLSVPVYFEEGVSVESGKTKDLGNLKPKPRPRK